MAENIVGVIGATSLVGADLLKALAADDTHVIAFSRQQVERLPDSVKNANVRWVTIASDSGGLPQLTDVRIKKWICVAPIWIIETYLQDMKQYGADKVVAVSSTSVITKQGSQDSAEEETVRKLARGEAELQKWANENGISCVVLRPTLIYGRGRDKNISEIARLIRRLKFFPLLGKGNGLRQPIHSADVADSCVRALQAQLPQIAEFNICGGSTISYRQMVEEVFRAMGRRARVVSFPLWLFSVLLFFLRILPRYRKWNVQMACRIEKDLVFDSTAAREALGFCPKTFNLTDEDLPQ